MDAITFSKWLQRQGYHIYRTTSSFWYDAGPRVLQAFPYHWLITPDTHELRSLTLKNNTFALRYSTPLNAPEGIVSYHVVLDDPNYCSDKLRTQARNGIRRGLENFSIERISFERLADEGWKLQQDTLDRQNRLDSMRRAEWEKICLSAEGLPGFEAWAAIVNGALAASLLTCQIDDKGYVPYALSHREYLRMHVNNALFYTVSREIISRPGVTGIFFSLHSLDAPESVNEFKFRMGFTAFPVRQRVVLHPLLKPFASPTIHNLMLSRVEKGTTNSFLAKAEGMLRFYLQGKQPLQAQDWPNCLGDRKEAILNP